MRSLPLALLPLLAACGAEVVCGYGTHLEGRLCVPGADVVEDTGDPWAGPHPLVPEEYQYIWNTEACETRDGSEGHQVYIYLVEAHTSSDMQLTGTERWYWFWSEPGWEYDCIDTLEITGVKLMGDYQGYGCGECDEGYEIHRRVVESNCGVSYRWLLSEDEDIGESYRAAIMLDTLTPSGNPNVDNRMLVLHASPDRDGEFSDFDNDWAIGHIYPDTEDVYGPPASYDWVAERCVRAY